MNNICNIIASNVPLCAIIILVVVLCALVVALWCAERQAEEQTKRVKIVRELHTQTALKRLNAELALDDTTLLLEQSHAELKIAQGAMEIYKQSRTTYMCACDQLQKELLEKERERSHLQNMSAGLMKKLVSYRNQLSKINKQTT